MPVRGVNLEIRIARNERQDSRSYHSSEESGRAERGSYSPSAAPTSPQMEVVR